MSANNTEAEPPKNQSRESRMVFIAVSFIAFIWVSLFIILPAMTGKSGIAQNMQQDLQEKTSPAGPERQ